MTNNKGIQLLRPSFRQCVEPESSDFVFSLVVIGIYLVFVICQIGYLNNKWNSTLSM